MSRMPARALAAARPLILGLTVINLGYAAIIISLLCASFFVEGWPWKPLGFELATMSPQAPLGLRAIMVIGIVCAVIVHTILRRLLAIVDTVRGGDAFVASNAQRLSAIAWSVLTIELMRLAVLAISGAARAAVGHGVQVVDDVMRNVVEDAAKGLFRVVGGHDDDDVLAVKHGGEVAEAGSKSEEVGKKAYYSTVVAPDSSFKSKLRA